MEIQIKRIYVTWVAEDGFRVLVDRLWPRGVSKIKAKIDWWDKALAPSTELRQWYHQNREIHWSVFQQRYLEELDQAQGAVAEFFEKAANQSTVTLIYGAKDPEHNHALVLQSFLKQKISPDHGASCA